MGGSAHRRPCVKYDDANPRCFCWSFLRNITIFLPSPSRVSTWQSRAPPGSARTTGERGERTVPPQGNIPSLFFFQFIRSILSDPTDRDFQSCNAYFIGPRFSNLYAFIFLSVYLLEADRTKKELPCGSRNARDARNCDSPSVCSARKR